MTEEPSNGRPTHSDRCTADIPFNPPIALASLSGQSDAAWARSAVPYAGVAFLGGIAIDARTRNAARAMANRNRDEFLPPDVDRFLEQQLNALEDVPIRAGVNVRVVDTSRLRSVASLCAKHDAIVELNAHCRQPEMCAIGAGHALLKDRDRLVELLSVATDTGATVGVKVRTEVTGVTLPRTCSAAARAGAELIHVDAMDSESVVGEVAAAIETDASVIANNGVRDHESVSTYLQYGADAVSVGRASDDKATLRRVRNAVQAHQSAREVRKTS